MMRYRPAFFSPSSFHKLYVTFCEKSIRLFITWSVAPESIWVSVMIVSVNHVDFSSLQSMCGCASTNAYVVAYCWSLCVTATTAYESCRVVRPRISVWELDGYITIAVYVADDASLATVFSHGRRPAAVAVGELTHPIN
jgi:hypothetical protein